ncbi:DUF1634 domain-containing protein [Geomonas sp. RF6]|uniref:DUF1634 domain-containing protein n=1 Tax=Geomonas sp. RF6 TaxID=2897342 RepID=UPI001E6167B1|nr:DUF1634 domain-containing protein [Geomonas sp. RF6]UFS69999.1 DUF1634 domain-containing protein [Geomonas sp. RF6]
MRQKEELQVNVVEEERIRQVELAISQLLRIGVILSLLLIVGGTIVTFCRHPLYVSSTDVLQRLTEPGAAFPHTLRDVVAGLRELRGLAIVTVGLLLLIATPVLRVAISILGFIYQGDRVFTAITTVVLGLLLLSLVLGKVG